MGELLWFILLAAQAGPAVERGAKVFASSCAVGYCHGPAGAAARGPRLRDRKFTRDEVMKATRDGVPRSAMPAWKGKLPESDIEAVVGYVMSLNNGGAAVGSPAPAPTPSTPAAKEDPFEAYFLDKCAQCHKSGNKGTPVAGEIAKGQTPPTTPRRVKVVKLKDGETFPAMVGSEDPSYLVVYDLTEPPPVKRSLAKEEVVSIAPNPTWKHP